MKIEPIDFILENNLSAWRANIIKYACRAGYKLYPDKTKQESEMLDLEKAVRWAEKRIRIIRQNDKVNDFIDLDTLDILGVTRQCAKSTPAEGWYKGEVGLIPPEITRDMEATNSYGETTPVGKLKEDPENG